jgi:flagellar biosynthesis/type III secretory pathway chaperone
MDPAVCREHLAELLGEELVLLSQLQNLLEAERELLGASRIEELEHTTRERQERLGALARIEEQRRALCSLHGKGTDRAGLEHLLQWCDPHGALAPRLAECVGRAMRCRELNDHNGLVVAARMKRVSDLLQALTGRATRADTYGPRGYGGQPAAGRVLGAG